MAVVIPPVQTDTTLQDSIMKILNMYMGKKKQQDEMAQQRLSNIMEYGGEPTEDEMANIQQRTGVNLQSLLTGGEQQLRGADTGQVSGVTQTTKKPRIMSREERQVAAKGKEYRQMKDINAEYFPKELEQTKATESAKSAIRVGEAKQISQEITIPEKKATLDMEFENAKKISEQIKIPEMKKHFEFMAAEEIAVKRADLSNSMALAKYKQGLESGGTTTPLQQAHIKNIESQANYHNALANYYNNVKGGLQDDKNANTAYGQQLRQHAQFMKDNKDMFYKKGKHGTMKPVEYEVGSPEAVGAEEALKAGGIDYKVYKKGSWYGGAESVYFVPVAPTPPSGKTGTTPNQQMPTPVGKPFKTKSGKRAQKYSDGTARYLD